ELAPLTFDTSLSGSGIIAAIISEKAAAVILGAMSKDLKSLQTALDTENPHAAPSQQGASIDSFSPRGTSGERAGERGSLSATNDRSKPVLPNSETPGGKGLLSPALSSKGGEGEASQGGIATSKVKVKISTGVQQIRKSDNNVVAELPPTGDSAHAQ